MKDNIKQIHKLTPKQEMFIQELLKGNTASESYRKSYNAKGMKASAIHCEASKLKSSPKVSQRYKTLLKRKEEYSINSAISLRQLVLEQLRKEALDINNNSNSRIRALKFKHVSEYLLSWKTRPHLPRPPVSYFFSIRYLTH